MSKVVTGTVRLAYEHVWEPWSGKEGQDKKYSACLIISKDDKKTLQAIKEAIADAIENGSQTLGGKSKGLKIPLRDGDTEREDQPEFANSYFINANSKKKPGIVDKNVQAILDQDEVYSGCYVKASINFFAYNSNGSKGIGCGLNNIHKMKDGDTLAGGSRAEDDFEKEEDTDFDDIL